MADLMDRYVGREWEQRYDALAAIREQQAADRLYRGSAWAKPEIEPVWAGVRRTDEETSAVGFYGFFENREGKTELQFRPVMADLDHEEAERLADPIEGQLSEHRRPRKST